MVIILNYATALCLLHLGLCHLRCFQAAVVWPVLSKNITKTLIPLLVPYRTWFEISNCRYLRPWHFTVGKKLRWSTASRLYFITEESESQRSKVRTRGRITRSKLGPSPVLRWPFWIVSHFIYSCTCEGTKNNFPPTSQDFLAGIIIKFNRDRLTGENTRSWFYECTCGCVVDWGLKTQLVEQFTLTCHSGADGRWGQEGSLFKTSEGGKATHMGIEKQTFGK